MFRNQRAAALVLIMVPFGVFAADPTEKSSGPPESGRESYVHYVLGRPSPYAKSAAGAGISQATTTPHEWGGGVVGYTRRFGSAFGKHIIKSTIQYSVAHWRHEEIHYQPSNKHGFGPRLTYALESTVITHKTTTGNRTVATGEIAGAIGSGMISRLWQPASTRTIAAGFGSAGVSLGADAGYHVLREFWPEIRHPHRHSSLDAQKSVAQGK